MQLKKLKSIASDNMASVNQIIYQILPHSIIYLVYIKVY